MVSNPSYYLVGSNFGNKSIKAKHTPSNTASETIIKYAYIYAINKFIIIFLLFISGFLLAYISVDINEAMSNTA